VSIVETATFIAMVARAADIAGILLLGSSSTEAQ
jgi:hypothetical protein